jgi:ABC-type transport system involved in multi-copper enzyme maturation permease subunit
MVFAAVGMVAVLVARRRSLGLLSAIGLWLIVTFAVPQFTSGLRPTQSLNPIVDPVGTSQAFFRLTASARPFSLAEQFKQTSSWILATAPGDSRPVRGGSVGLVVAALVLITAALFVVVARHDFSRSDYRD